MKSHQRQTGVTAQAISILEPDIEVIDKASWIMGLRKLPAFVAFRSVPGYPTLVVFTVAASLLLITVPFVVAFIFSADKQSSAWIFVGLLCSVALFPLFMPLIDRLLRRAISRRDHRNLQILDETPITGAGFSDALVGFAEGPMDRGAYSLSSTSLQFRGYASQVRLPLNVIEKVSVIAGSLLYPAVVRVDYRFPDGATGVLHLEDYTVGLGRRATKSAKALAHAIESARRQALAPEPYPVYPIFIPRERLMAAKVQALPKPRLRRIWILSTSLALFSCLAIDAIAVLVRIFLRINIFPFLPPLMPSVFFIVMMLLASTLIKKEVNRRNTAEQEELLRSEAKSDDHASGP